MRPWDFHDKLNEHDKTLSRCIDIGFVSSLILLGVWQATWGADGLDWPHWSSWLCFVAFIFSSAITWGLHIVRAYLRTLAKAVLQLHFKQQHPESTPSEPAFPGSDNRESYWSPEFRP